MEHQVGMMKDESVSCVFLGLEGHPCGLEGHVVEILQRQN